MLGLVIGGVGNVAGALYGGVFLLGIVLLKEIWDVPLLRSIEFIGPALAALAIIGNPAGAVESIGRATAHLLPWRTDARIAEAARREAEAEPEVGELGIDPVVHRDRRDPRSTGPWASADDVPRSGSVTPGVGR